MKLLIISIMLMLSLPCSASVTEFHNDGPGWQNAVGDYSTITFTEFPEGTHVSDHYANLGITFTDGIDIIYHSDGFSDGAGLNGAFQSITVAFDASQYWIAVEQPGLVQYKLFNDGQLIYTSGVFFDPVGPANGFSGLVSTVSFDTAMIFGPSGAIFIDNLYFGPSIPAPGALALLGIGGTLVQSRRRRP